MDRGVEVQQAKQLVWDVFTGVRPSPLHTSVTLAGPSTVGAIDGSHAVHDQINEPLLDAILKPKWAPRAFIGGYDGDDLWVAHIGTLTGTFVRDLWGIPASGRQAAIRFGEFSRVVGDRIHEVRSVVDLPWLAAQVGLDPLPATRPVPDSPTPSVRSLHPAAAVVSSSETAATSRLLETLVDRWHGFPERGGLAELWSDDAVLSGSHGLDQIQWHIDGGSHVVAVRDEPVAVRDPGHLVSIAEGPVAAFFGRPALDEHDPPELRVMAFLTRRDDRFADAQVLVDLVQVADAADLELLQSSM